VGSDQSPLDVEGGAASHQSGKSSNQQVIKAACHQSSMSSERLVIEALCHQT